MCRDGEENQQLIILKPYAIDFNNFLVNDVYSGKSNWVVGFLFKNKRVNTINRKLRMLVRDRLPKLFELL